MRTRHLNRLLIVGILIVSTAPLFAQAQPDAAKLKADAQKVVSIISGDKTKTDTFCQMLIVGKQVDEAIQEKDNTKAMVWHRSVDHDKAGVNIFDRPGRRGAAGCHQYDSTTNRKMMRP